MLGKLVVEGKEVVFGLEDSKSFRLTDFSACAISDKISLAKLTSSSFIAFSCEHCFKQTFGEMMKGTCLMYFIGFLLESIGPPLIG